MLLEKITEYLDDRELNFSYIKDDLHIEIWVNGKGWSPILVSKQNSNNYLISWCGVEYRIEDEEKAYAYILRIFTNIDEVRNQEKHVHESRSKK